MAKLLFVVHRYAPYPGGSEINTHRLASEAVLQGHDVLVLSDTHYGNFEGVQVTSDRRVAYDRYDMIIVHGSCPTQDFILAQPNLPSPIFYLLIEPPKNFTARELGTKHATWIGYGTSADYAFIQTLSPDRQQKARPFVYGLPLTVIGTPGNIKSTLRITTPYMAMSAGGFWPHKQFAELVRVFNDVNHPDWSLVLFGYDQTHGTIPTHNNPRVYCIADAESSDIYDAMQDSDLYIMNSATEGYGLTLLESMYNHLPWISRDIAAGHDLRVMGYGRTYSTDDDLYDLLAHPPIVSQDDRHKAYEYALQYHSVSDSLNSILRVL